MPRGEDGQLIDDHDGAVLPADTPETTLVLGTMTYHLYLSAENREKLREALAPFTEGADTEDYTERMHNIR